ncbi:aspartate 1-decarboxylase [Kosmotoga pacifica]|uniref:Aspartate 1-decarboxylase n=1 Tax=Kosmotoga pacifica TaxID=1330330 RepID=A0A0G2Z6D3_9BACT|nr:aspartate 1-decarboxylase [Kosmotoga pacifica]AKI97160.1 aspartate decarboxylase [Kosmotoga pacifica]
MFRIMQKSKIHRAVVTQKDLNYEGSITIDEELMELADLYENELVQVVNINNGLRFETYVIKGEKGSGVIGLNGAAARLAEIGDLIIIISYGMYAEGEYDGPKIVKVDKFNKPLDKE